MQSRGIPAIPLPTPWADLEVEFRVKVSPAVFRSRVRFLETYDGWQACDDWVERRDWILGDGSRYSAQATSGGSPRLEASAVRKRTHLARPVVVRFDDAGPAISGKVVSCTEIKVPRTHPAVHPPEVERWRHKQTRAFRTPRWTFYLSRVWESTSGYSRLLRDRLRGMPPSSHEIEVEANADSDLFSKGPEYVRLSLQMKVEDLFADVRGTVAPAGD